MEFCILAICIYHCLPMCFSFLEQFNDTSDLFKFSVLSIISLDSFPVFFCLSIFLSNSLPANAKLCPRAGKKPAVGFTFLSFLFFKILCNHLLLLYHNPCILKIILFAVFTLYSPVHGRFVSTFICNILFFFLI